MDHNSKKTSTF